MPLGKIALSETPELNLTTDYSMNELTLLLVSQLDFGGLCQKEGGGSLCRVGISPCALLTHDMGLLIPVMLSLAPS